jgi:hypothetical protein
MRKILFVFLAFAACSDNDNHPNPGGGAIPDAGGGGGGGSGGGSAADIQQDFNDVAVLVAANLSTGELPAMVDAINMACGRNPAGFTIMDHTDSAGVAFQTLDGMRGGLTVQYKLFCRDDQDAETKCNGNENHAHVKPTYTGTLAAADASIDSVQRSAAWIVRDVGMATPRIGGAGTESFASHLATGDYMLMLTDTLKDTRFDKSDPTTPTSGTLDLSINVQRTRQGAVPADRSFTVMAHIVFTGDDTATMTLDQTQIYAVTISTGAVVKQ